MTDQSIPGDILITTVPINRIQPNPWQTRLAENPEHIRQLADDIRMNGLMSAPVVRIHPENPIEYQLAFGHSRLAAYRLLFSEAQESGDENGCSRFFEIPVDVRSLSDQEMAEYAIRENALRHDLTAIEKAKALQRYITDFHVTQEQAGALFGLGQSAVANLLRLLRLPESIQAKVHSGELPERMARQLLAVEKISPVRAEKIVAQVLAEPADEREDAFADAVDDALGKNGRDLDDDLFPTAWSGMSADIPSCEGCPSRIIGDRILGDGRCADPACFERKRVAFAQLRLAVLPAETGILAAAPDEKATPIKSNWETGMRVAKAIQAKVPSLRWVLLTKPLDNACDAGEEAIQDAARTLSIGLGTVDLPAWKKYLEAGTGDRARLKREAEKAEAADDPKARAQHEKAVRAMRAEKGAKIRNRYDIAWIVRNAVGAIGKGIAVRGPAAAYLAERMEVHARWRSSFELMDAFEEEVAAGLASKTVEGREARARLALAFFLFWDAMGFDSENRGGVEECLVTLAKDVDVNLPNGWGRPPIHKTTHNCWHCGRFASNDGKVSQAEIEDGWSRVLQGEKILDVTCPDCDKKPPAKTKPAKKSAKPKKK